MTQAIPHVIISCRGICTACFCNQVESMCLLLHTFSCAHVHSYLCLSLRLNEHHRLDILNGYICLIKTCRGSEEQTKPTSDHTIFSSWLMAWPLPDASTNRSVTAFARTTESKSIQAHTIYHPYPFKMLWFHGFQSMVSVKHIHVGKEWEWSYDSYTLYVRTYFTNNFYAIFYDIFLNMFCDICVKPCLFWTVHQSNYFQHVFSKSFTNMYKGEISSKLNQI